MATRRLVRMHEVALDSLLNLDALSQEQHSSASDDDESYSQPTTKGSNQKASKKKGKPKKARTKSKKTLISINKKTLTCKGGTKSSLLLII